MRAFLLTLFVAVALVAVWPATGGATNECKGIMACIVVPGPWVLVEPGHESEYLLSCPKGQGIVAGLDAQGTSRNVRVSFDGALGAPISPGITTSSSTLFRGLTLSKHQDAFEPLLGCVPASGGGGRSTVSARVVPQPTPVGLPLDPHAQTVVVRPGLVRTASVRCPANEQLAASWDALAFRTKGVPDLAQAANIQVHRAIVKGKAVVTVLATDALSPDAKAVVQVGVECAP